MARTSNGGGEWINREELMALYDQLPAEVRRVMADAPISVASRDGHILLRRYDAIESAELLAGYIRQAMLNPSAPTGTTRAWTYKGVRGYIKDGDGRNHPQADPAYPWPNYQVKPRIKRADT